MNKIILLVLMALSAQANATLIDKVAGVINDNVYTLSEVTRVQNTLDIRKEIAPFIYKDKSSSQGDILRLMQNKFIIKDKLSELGFVISDDAVESRIKETEKSLRLNRPELLQFLKSKGISFNEYFELLREAMEYSVFQRRIIAPLVTITDQELKNFYYNMNSSNKALSFKYKVVDFTLPENKVLKSDLDRLPAILETYKKTGNIPQIYADISTNDLGNVSDEDLPKDLSKLLKSTDENRFSKLYIKGGVIHSFYLVSKDLAESSDFIQKRNLIYNQIFLKRSSKIAQNWFSRESLSYYLLTNL
ncbi:MAG: peptidyl-prolyl cis-trans isomerase SurA [Bacteriovoracaceae bacterium]|jgi:peptidyl-prolyl cis-trans isomerase SurA